MRGQTEKGEFGRDAGYRRNPKLRGRLKECPRCGFDWPEDELLEDPKGREVCKYCLDLDPES